MIYIFILTLQFVILSPVLRVRQKFLAVLQFKQTHARALRRASLQMCLL